MVSVLTMPLASILLGATTAHVTLDSQEMALIAVRDMHRDSATELHNNSFLPRKHKYIVFPIINSLLKL